MVDINNNNKTLDKPIWIHIGMPKCASTSLQKGFFAARPEIDFIGRNDNVLGLPSRHAPLLALASLDELGYQTRKDDIRKELLNSFSEDESVRVRVLSDEIIGAAYRPYIHTIPVADIYQSATRLKELFPDAHILMVIRNQKKLLASWYPQLMRNIGSRFDVHKCFKMHQEYFESGQGSFFHQMNFNRVYQIYTQLFSKKKVDVVCLEDISKDQISFLTTLIKKMGLPEKINPEEYMQQRENTRAMEGEFKNNIVFSTVGRMLQFLPKDFKKRLKGMTMGKTIEVNFSDDELRFIERIYWKGNRELQKATGLDLKGNGYPLGN